MKLSVPKASPSASLWRPMGESPVSAGVVPGSQASGKVANCEVRIEVSQTAVSVSRWNRENYILRLLGRMRYHMLPKSKTLKRDCTEIVDVAAIDTRIPAGRRRVRLTWGGLDLYVLRIEKSAEVIVVNWMSRHHKDKVGVLTGLMKACPGQ
jgi:hypothetical protein